MYFQSVLILGTSIIATFSIPFPSHNNGHYGTQGDVNYSINSVVSIFDALSSTIVRAITCYIKTKVQVRMRTGRVNGSTKYT